MLLVTKYFDLFLARAIFSVLEMMSSCHKEAEDFDGFE